MSTVSKIVLAVIFAVMVLGAVIEDRRLVQKQQLVDVTLTGRVDQLTGRVDSMPNEAKTAREQMEILIRDLEFRMKALDAKNPETAISDLQAQVKALDEKVVQVKKDLETHNHPILAKDKKGQPVIIRNSVLPPEQKKVIDGPVQK